MNSFVKFFHEFFHPHCTHCELERQRAFELKQAEIEEKNHCVSCDTLQTTNDALMRENNRLVEALIEKNKNVPEPVVVQEVLKPIRTSSHVPWNVRRQLKEQESRAELLAKQNAAQPNTLNKDKEMEEIEKELQDVGTTEKAG